MADYREPTKAEFSDAENTVVDAIGRFDGTVMSRVGSAVRELIARPMAYVLSWFSSNSEDILEKSSVRYLKTSSATDNDTADRVASNYFITRRPASYAEGSIAVYTTATSMRIQAGSSFTAAGVGLTVQGTVFGSLYEPAYKSDGITYVGMVSTGQTYEGLTLYSFNVPVKASSEDYSEVSSGTEAVAAFAAAGLVKCLVASPITGGSGPETDASMMARAEYGASGAAVGTEYGIYRRLEDAPVTVLSMHADAGDSQSLYRARYNTVNVNPGCTVDAHVKTSLQYMVGEVYRDMSGQSPVIEGGKPVWTIPGLIPSASENQVYAGIIRFMSVAASGTRTSTSAALLVSDGTYVLAEGSGFSYGGVDYSAGDIIPDGITIPAGNSIVYSSVIEDLDVTYSSASAYYADAAGARLSTHQRATVSFTAAPGVLSLSSVTVSFRYIPGISDLQETIDDNGNCFIGQDILIKAAIPVSVGVSASYEAENDATEDQIASLKAAMADFVNNKRTGDGVLNFSDLRTVCAEAVPGITLRLPCILTASVMLRSGAFDPMYSNSGILDITLTASGDRFPQGFYYLSLVKDSISLVRAE